MRYDEAVVSLVDLHGFRNFIVAPDTAGGIVGIAENRRVDMVFLDLPVHVFVVHAPCPVFVADKRAMNNVVPVRMQRPREAYISRAVEKDRVAGFRKDPKGGYESAQYPVFIGDDLRGDVVHPFPDLVPPCYSRIIFFRSLEIAESGMGSPLYDSFGHGLRRREVHVRHPQGNRVKALFRGRRGKAREFRVSDAVYGDGVVAVPLQQSLKVVGAGHRASPFLVLVLLACHALFSGFLRAAETGRFNA